MSELVEHCPFGMLIVDSELEILKVNRRSKDGAFADVRPLVGRPLEEAVRILWPEDAAPEIVAAFRQTLDTGAPYPANTRSRRPPDEKHAEGWELHRLRLPDETLGVVCYYYDSTQLPRATEQRPDKSLRENELRYRAVVESQTEMVCRFRTDGAILFVNEAYARAVRSTVAALEGSSFWPHVAEADRPQVRAMLDQLTPSHPEVQIENRFETADGPRWTLWLNRALAFDATGRCVEAQSTGIDITERKRAEERLQASRDAFYGLVKNSPFGVYLVDADFRLAEVSAGAAATFAGVDPLLGRDFAAILRTIWPEPFATQAIDIFRRTLATGEPYISEDFEERRADRGIEEAYDWRTERVMMPDGRFGVVCYFYELTSQRRLEHELRLANDRSEAAVAALRESDRRKDEFLATLSHELRNPLAPMRYALEFLEQVDAETAPIAEARAMMKRQMAHLVRLMDDLLDVSRISRGKINLQRERVELTGVIAHAAETARLLAASSDQKIVLELPDEAIHVDADPVRLAQVVGNLLNNACRYSERGARISCTARREAGDALISVKDEGVGIPPERLGELFDMFSQLERTLERSRGGLGIGLHLVKRLVELHGGTVEARSAGLGQGSEFIVRLPVAAPVESTVSAGAEARAKPGGDSDRRRILVVDDNVDAAQSLAMLLRLSGRATELANDGEEAVKKAADYRPDAILLDIAMPKMNGYDVCRMIRRSPGGRAPLIVALSGYGSDEDRRKSAEAGFDAHLVKPVDLAALEHVLAHLDERGTRPDR